MMTLNCRITIILSYPTKLKIKLNNGEREYLRWFLTEFDIYIYIYIYLHITPYMATTNEINSQVIYDIRCVHKRWT